MTPSIELDIVADLDRFPLEVSWRPPARFLAIFGPSGAGKTTILETIAGLRRDVRGTVRVAGRTWQDTAAGVFLAPEKRGVGYVPQDGLLFPHRDVVGNLRSGRRGRARRAALPVQRIMQVLELEGLGHRRIGMLSGGEKRRVALGRALCSGPDILLLDEPMAGLDVALRRRILPYLVRVRDEFGIPTVHVSHDATDAWILSREVIVLEAGRIRARGRPEDVFTSASVLPLARTDGFESILRGVVEEIPDDTALVRLDTGPMLRVPGDGLSSGECVSVALRAEDLILAVHPPTGLSARNALEGRVREIRRGALGTQVQVLVDVGRPGVLLVAAITARSARSLGLAEGMAVHIICKVQSCRVLAGGRQD